MAHAILIIEQFNTYIPVLNISSVCVSLSPLVHLDISTLNTMFQAELLPSICLRGKKGENVPIPLQFIKIGFYVVSNATQWHDLQHEIQFLKLDIGVPSQEPT